MTMFNPALPLPKATVNRRMIGRMLMLMREISVTDMSTDNLPLAPGVGPGIVVSMESFLDTLESSCSVGSLVGVAAHFGMDLL